MCDKLIELDAVLRLYEQNFRNLHWNAKGNDFNDSHKSITTEYYEMVSKDIDAIAEMLAMFNIDPFNYIEAVEYITKSENKYLVIDSKVHYTRAQIIDFSAVMLSCICTILADAIEEMTNPIDAGIKSELETMLYNYSLQTRYINKRRGEE